jgi:hypothetical protein
MSSSNPPGIIDFKDAAPGVKGTSVSLETSLYRKEDLKSVMKEKRERVRSLFSNLESALEKKKKKSIHNNNNNNRDEAEEDL